MPRDIYMQISFAAYVRGENEIQGLVVDCQPISNMKDEFA